MINLWNINPLRSPNMVIDKHTHTHTHTHTKSLAVAQRKRKKTAKYNSMSHKILNGGDQHIESGQTTIARRMLRQNKMFSCDNRNCFELQRTSWSLWFSW